MPRPTRLREKKLRRQGYKLIAGVDEAGRGAWAGPIVAAAVILDPKIKISGLNDSKLLRSPVRQALYKEIIKQAKAWSVAAVSPAVIDRIGISKANVLAMERAIGKLNPPPDFVLTDAVLISYENIKSQPIIKGDRKVSCIAAASIVAKVTRDKIMDELDEKYPKYGFKHHKGYGTNHHFHMLNVFGICDIHRKSYKPIKDLLN